MAWTLGQLQTFVTVAELGSMTRAADQLGYSVGAVSQHMSALRRTVGSDLVIRRGRSLVLTEAGRTLLPRGTVVLTLGAMGCFVSHREDSLRGDGQAHYRCPAAAARVVDTTGAGDAFCGTFAAALAQGADMVEAVQLGAAAGSLATRKAGAAGSYATEAEVRALAKDFFSSAN